MVGVSFIEATIRDVVFKDCKARYINFSFSKINALRVVETDLSEMTFLETMVKRLELDNVDLSNSEISKTNLNGVDFSNSKIDNKVIDAISLKGIVIDRFQSQELVRILGVKFKS